MNFPGFPHLIYAGVAPFTPHAPWATRTSTSFGARGSSVSTKFGSSDIHSVPSAGAGKLIPTP